METPVDPAITPRAQWDAEVDAWAELTGRFHRRARRDKLLMDWNAVMGELQADSEKHNEMFVCPCGCERVILEGYP